MAFRATLHILCESTRQTDEWATFSEGTVLWDPRVVDYVKTHPDNISLFGYYQCYRYFHPYRAQVLAQFSFPENTLSPARAFLRRVLAQRGEVTLVGVHVRRGDYVNAVGLKGNRPPTTRYFRFVGRLFNLLCDRKVFFDSNFTPCSIFSFTLSYSVGYSLYSQIFRPYFSKKYS